MASLALAGIQCDLAWEDPASNHARARAEVARARAAGARLVVLPEMFPTGFSMHVERTAEPPDGATATLLGELAREHDAWVAGTFACRGDHAPMATNRLLLAGPQGQARTYDKIHPFSYGGEDQHFSQGHELVVADVDGVRVGLFTCYDLRFANVFWEIGPQVDAFVVPANWPEARRHHWRSLLVARAIENQAWMLGVNRVGTGRRVDGGDLDYAGDSLLVDPLGAIVASAAEDPTLLLGTIDTARVTDVRAQFPFLPDRRRVDDLQAG